MIIKITNKIVLQDDPSSDFALNGNNNSFDWTYDGDSKEVEVDECTPPSTVVVKDFVISNANRFVYELKHGNSFDVNIQQDIIRGDAGEIVSLHAYCYEVSKTKPYRLPVRFDVVLDDVDAVIASTCDFSLGNIKNLSHDIRINNVQVPIDSKVNLVIIVATKEF